MSFMSVLESYGMGWQRDSNWISTEDEDVGELGVMLEKEHANPVICAIGHFYVHHTSRYITTACTELQY